MGITEVQLKGRAGCEIDICGERQKRIISSGKHRGNMRRGKKWKRRSRSQERRRY